MVGHVVMTKEPHVRAETMTDQNVTAMTGQRVRVATMKDQNALVMKNLNVASGQVSVLKLVMIANERDDQIVAGQVLQDQGQVDRVSVAMIAHAVADQIARVEDLLGVNVMNVQRVMSQKNELTLMIR